MANFSIGQQIECIEREIKMRRDVYPRQVQKNKMRQGVADYEIDCMEAVKRSLEWNREHRGHIIDWISAGKPNPVGKPR